jgi:hypothetical protein
MKGSYNCDRKELLINFGAAAFKKGRQRLVNSWQFFVLSCLRVNQALGDVAELKRLLLKNEHLSAIPWAIPSGIALATTEALATAEASTATADLSRHLVCHSLSDG